MTRTNNTNAAMRRSMCILRYGVPWGLQCPFREPFLHRRLLRKWRFIQLTKAPIHQRLVGIYREQKEKHSRVVGNIPKAFAKNGVGAFSSELPSDHFHWKEIVTPTKLLCIKTTRMTQRAFTQRVVQFEYDEHIESPELRNLKPKRSTVIFACSVLPRPLMARFHLNGWWMMTDVIVLRCLLNEQVGKIWQAQPIHARSMP